MLHKTKSLLILVSTMMGLFVFTDTIAAAEETISTRVTVGNYSEKLREADIAMLLEIAPQLTLGPRTRHAEIENTDYCAFPMPCSLFLSIRDREHVITQSQFALDETAALAYLEDLATRVDREPVNAKLSVIDETVVVTTHHTDGVALDQEKSVALLRDYVNDITQHRKASRVITLPHTTVTPPITAATITQAGIKEVIGEGRSNFAGSSPDRIHNIRTAASRFDNLLIAPGEEFSFVQHLGPVDGAHGFRKELVIKANKTTPEYGGGVCQVSTTIFRGAIHTGMKITQRRNHSYPVKYYEPIGFDATIYIPAPDMRFKNNTPGYLLLQTEMQGTELVFRFYGTQDGRDVEMSGPHVTQRNPDGSMKTYFTQTVKDKSGTILIDDTFSSNYRSPQQYPRE